MGFPWIGAFGLLFLLGNTFNLYSMIGLVLLVGLVTNRHRDRQWVLRSY